MRLLLFPDPGLRRPASPVQDFGPPLDPIVDGLTAIMRQAGAIGLTAAHCGLPLRLVLVRPPTGPEALYANPIVTWSSAERLNHEEGSVSMPGVRAKLSRPACIRLAFQDRDGKQHETDVEGFDAAILLHEIDQLDGIFWLDRLSRLQRERITKSYAKLRRA